MTDDEYDDWFLKLLAPDPEFEAWLEGVTATDPETLAELERMTATDPSVDALIKGLCNDFLKHVDDHMETDEQ